MAKTIPLPSFRKTPATLPTEAMEAFISGGSEAALASSSLAIDVKPKALELVSAVDTSADSTVEPVPPNTKTRKPKTSAVDATDTKRWTRVQRASGEEVVKMSIYLPANIARKLRVMTAQADLKNESQLIAQILEEHLK